MLSVRWAVGRGLSRKRACCAATGRVALLTSSQRKQEPVGRWSSLVERGKRYGPFFVVYYTAVWITTGVGIFFAIEHVGNDAVLDTLKQLGVDQFVDLSKVDTQLGNAVTAVVLNELIEPLRLPIGIATVAPMYRVYMKVSRSLFK